MADGADSRAAVEMSGGPLLASEVRTSRRPTHPHVHFVDIEPAEERMSFATTVESVPSTTRDSRPSVEPQPDIHQIEQFRHRRTSLWEPGGGHRHGHRVSGAQWTALFVWVVLLMLQYWLVRATCKLGIPPDCHERGDPVEDLSDIHYILFNGGLLAIFAGVHWPDRFKYIFNFTSDGKFRGLVFVASVAFSGVGWGCLSMVPALEQFSLTGFNPAYAVPMVILLVSTVFLVAWHIREAWKYSSKPGFAAYVASRLALSLVYGAYIVLKIQHKDIDFHFHHYAVAFLAAAFAEFNHPLSMLLLAGGTGVFVQGVAVYGAAPIVKHDEFYFYLTNKRGEEVKSPPVSEDAYWFFRDHCRFKNFVSG